MNKSAYLAAVAVLALLSVGFITKLTKPSGATTSAPASMSVYDMHLKTDVTTLPVQETKEPF